MSSPVPAGAFTSLDDRLLAAHADPGVIVVHAPLNAHAAIAAHVARRLRAQEHAPIEVVNGDVGTPSFRETATQLGLSVLPSDPLTCAAAIARAALAARSALILPLPSAGTWDCAVASELARHAPPLLLVFVGDGESTSFSDAVPFELGAELSREEKRRWMTALAEDTRNGIATAQLFALEEWWSSARRVAWGGMPALDELDASSRDLLCCLALAGRSLSVTAIDVLGQGATDAAAHLVAAGLVRETNGFVGLPATADRDRLTALASKEMRLATARILADSSRAGGDPWADARAAELLLAAEAFDTADEAITRALRNIDDGQASSEIARRWFEAVMPVVNEHGLALRRSAAERALEMGEANDAHRWCESATSLAPDDPAIALMMGRVLVQLGDLVAARVYLHKAQRAATTDELYARVAAELAEVSYHAADLEQAAAYANTAIARATAPSTRLAARNTLGKIHLGAGAWDVCDEHFADDAATAHAHGDRTAELRARLNRGIALLSKGLVEDARAVLEGVLEDGARYGQDRARAYALHNLAVIAERQNDYGRALEHWEGSARFPVTLCGRISSARMLANLADLRLRLGLVAHADHTVAFGRRVLGARSSTGAAAYFAIVAARIAMARGSSTLARREIDRAITHAGGAGETEQALAEALLVSARVSLDDGDVNRARDAIEAAEARATSGRDLAELALLKALHLRATGRPAIDDANRALAAARSAGQEDLLIEIHTLLGALHRDAGDLLAAQAECARGLGVRDQMASSLSSAIQSAFLAKSNVCALSRLEASLAGPTSRPMDEALDAPRSGASASVTVARELVGDDPQIRSLRIAIRKVARSNSMVLVHGESGTGKELVAEALHRASDRASGPLVSVNCAALVETLLLSELFGHEKGAFTGAASRRRGRFELAEGGTLFLDEIGDISARTQVALLRVLQEKTFERVGGTQAIRANVRVVCATHRDLKAMVDRGEFREDLFYRLRGITLEVPALRARLSDLPTIAEHLLERIALERDERPKQLAPEAIQLLARHRWPGNIRELENVLRAAAVFAEGSLVEAADLVNNVDDLRALAAAANTPRTSSSAPPAGVDHDDEAESLVPDGESIATDVAYAQVRRGATSLSAMKRQIERDCIARALSETNGNITHAAALLGLKRPRLSQLVKQYRLSPVEVNK